ncbi:MAG: hypothetical protein DMG13_31130 [Acidobacteria bacterium]|nr:MAG: hypothetical protein DMG13_31130 [Acidobacteriota bacterium]
MASRAKKKWRYRRHGINQEMKSELISTGIVGAGINTRPRRSPAILHAASATMMSDRANFAAGSVFIFPMASLD